MWHDNETSLLKGHERRGEVSINFFLLSLQTVIFWYRLKITIVLIQGKTMFYTFLKKILNDTSLNSCTELKVCTELFIQWLIIKATVWTWMEHDLRKLSLVSRFPFKIRSENIWEKMVKNVKYLDTQRERTGLQSSVHQTATPWQQVPPLTRFPGLAISSIWNRMVIFPLIWIWNVNVIMSFF